MVVLWVSGCWRAQLAQVSLKRAPVSAVLPPVGGNLKPIAKQGLHYPGGRSGAGIGPRPQRLGVDGRANIRPGAAWGVWL